MGKVIMANPLKILSYNIQAGIPMGGVHHYLLNSWRHFLPHRGRLHNLKQIADTVKDYDLVGLQEVDGGSIRSSFVNQIDYLGREAEFLYWSQQNTRNFGRYAQHGNGLLSRYPVHQVKHYRLPNKIPGRGVMTCCLGSAQSPIYVVNAHLSLGKRGQLLQLDYLYELIAPYEHVILMGDFNMLPARLQHHPLIKTRGLVIANLNTQTFPSWRPAKLLDYIVLSPSLKLLSAEALPLAYSDHLPVSVSIALPEGIVLNPKLEHDPVREK